MAHDNACPCLARFEATNGTGLWEVYPWGLKVGGTCYGFTPTSHIVHSGVQGRSYRSGRLVEEQDDFGLWAALAVYQETGSWEDAGLAAWALGGSTMTPVVETHKIPGTVTLSIGGLRTSDNPDASLRYREDGQYVQVDAIQRFADVCLAAIKACREAHSPATSTRSRRRTNGRRP